MTKIYINEAMMPMHNPKGWPEAHTEGYAATDMYAVDLEEAKAEAVYFENLAEVTVLINEYIKPNTFIEIDAEVEVELQMRGAFTDWVPFDSDEYRGQPTRDIARIKKQQQQDSGAHSFTEAHGVIAPVNPHVAIGWKQVEPLTFGEEMEQIRRYGQDMQRENAELKAKLENADKRIKELEQWQQEELIVWGPVLDYCQDDNNTKRLGIGLGQSISTRVLEILKEYNQTDLRATLKNAEARIKELNEMYWIAEYALRDIDAFEWVIEPVTRARVALEKLSKMPIPVQEPKTKSRKGEI